MAYARFLKGSKALSLQSFSTKKEGLPSLFFIYFFLVEVFAAGLAATLPFTTGATFALTADFLVFADFMGFIS